MKIEDMEWKEMLAEASKMEVKIKKLEPNAVIPSYARKGDAGLDLTAISAVINREGIVQYGTGIAVEIPEGYVGLVFPRSSVFRTGWVMSNSVGVIDSGYRGEIKATFVKVNGHRPIPYSTGERVAQLVIIPYPTVELVEVDELSETERGTGGYGSTGK